MARENRNDTGGAGGGLFQMLIPLGLVTLIGGGGGGIFGVALLPQIHASRDKPFAEGAPADALKVEKGHLDSHPKNAAPAAESTTKLDVKELPPIVANLSGGKKQLVRLQSAIVYDPHELRNIEPLIASLMSDVTAFLSTLDLAAIEGADGLRRLQEELNERAAIRSESRIREFIVEALVVQ